MNIYAFSALINALTAIAFGAFGFSRNTKRFVNKLFGLMNTSVVLWSLSYFFWQISSTSDKALFWIKILTIGSTLIPVFYMHWVITILRENQRYKVVIKLGYLVTIVFVILVFLPGYISGVREILNFSYWPVGSFFYLLYVIIIYHGLSGFAVFLLFKNFVSVDSKDFRREQVKYVLLGSITALLGGVTNFPLWFGIKIPPVGTPFVVFYIALFGYAMIRHRLMDVRVVITRSLIYGILLTLVTLSFVFITFASAQFFGDTPTSRYLIAFFVAAVIVFGLEPFKRLLSRITDAVFFKAPINYRNALRSLSEKLSVEVDLAEILRLMRQDISRKLKTKHAEILIADEQGNLCRRENPTGVFSLCLSSDGELVKYLMRATGSADRSGLERKIEDTRAGPEQEHLKESLREMESLEASLMTPITTQGKLNAALVLGPKLSGDPFNLEELHLFEVLGPQIGSAIEKAKLFEEVKSFTQKLQIEVDRATYELKERNRFLLALQQLTGLITHTLDYKRVTQAIVDGIASELGYVGGILTLIDKGTGETWAEAITDTRMTRAAIKLLPHPVSNYRGNVNQQNLGGKVLRTGEILESEKLSDFLHPPVPAPLVAAIQKLTRIKYVVAVPIISEDQIIGSIVYGIGKPKKEISRQEIAMMKALADQAGIVIRNLRLFEAIQKANAELEEANEHLRSLDEAKSEFISIASHQLRTPMTGIMGYLSMLTSGDFGKIDPKIGPILDGILDASKRMIRLINIFLNITKIEAGRFMLAKSSVKLEEIIETEFIELKKLADDKKLKLIFEKPKPLLPQVNIDRDKMADVVQNLVDNAIKYTDKGKVIVTAEKTDHEVLVSVADDGRGINKDEVGKLFNKFMRGDGIARIHPDGSGLGLFIAKKIVEAHGGRIWVESEGEGKGSTFQFTIPI